MNVLPLFAFLALGVSCAAFLSNGFKSFKHPFVLLLFGVIFFFASSIAANYSDHPGDGLSYWHFAEMMITIAVIAVSALLGIIAAAVMKWVARELKVHIDFMEQQAYRASSDPEHTRPNAVNAARGYQPGDLHDSRA